MEVILGRESLEVVCHCLLPTANTVDQKGSSAFLDSCSAGQSRAAGYCYMEMCPSIPSYIVRHSNAPAANSVHNKRDQQEGVAADTSGKERSHAGTLCTATFTSPG